MRRIELHVKLRCLRDGCLHSFLVLLMPEKIKLNRNITQH